MAGADRLWAVVDVTAAVGILVTSVVTRSVWFWVIAAGWSVVAVRQVRLAMRGREPVNRTAARRWR